MTYIDSWPAFENPNIATVTAVLLALAAAAALAVPVVRVARKSKRFRPQSLLLLLVPALIVTGGARIDDARESAHREALVASGQAEEAWGEIESDLMSSYRIRSVEPLGDPVDAVSSVAEASTGNVAYSSGPLVLVRLDDTPLAEVFRIVPDGDRITLKRQVSAERLNEGVDPDRLLLDEPASDSEGSI